MNIKFNETENSIEIKDGLKNQYLILKILMILNLGNAIIRLISLKPYEYGVIEYFWIGIGIISVIVLFFFIYKKSTAEKINIAEIQGFKEKTIFGKNRYELELKNGKNRVLGKFNSENGLAEMHELFTKLGIPKK